MVLHLVVCCGPLQLVEVKLQYDGSGTDADIKAQCQAKNVSRHENNTCILNITIPEDMKSPVYVYYELDNFFQNHRRYVKSRDDDQLESGDPEENPTRGDFSSCSPLIEGDLEGSDGDKKILWPCGLIANSFFNGMCFV